MHSTAVLVRAPWALIDAHGACTVYQAVPNRYFGAIEDSSGIQRRKPTGKPLPGHVVCPIPAVRVAGNADGATVAAESKDSVMRVYLSMLLSLGLMIQGHAAEQQYSCTIERSYSLGPGGLRRDRRILNALDARSFVVDRTSGAITGSTLDNRQYTAEVVMRGDSENSFQAYWIVRGRAGARVRFIEVQEFADGARKPFRAIVQNWTYTGHCE